ncbi:BrnA antitoxin family protein [Mesorhizobium sp. LjRoot246]|uniref:BrnA antitoxin family protein n=1 Tax=Mesorhizobium sp. LjRoot246 TaxID=3342294 RepID=UPI003ECCFC2D
MGNPKSHVRPLTNEEEAEIQRQIAADPDDAEATDEELVQAKPFAEVFPELFESTRRSRGRPTVEKPKQVVSIRLDQDVVRKFKATGKGWQAKINEVLKNAKVG